MSQRSIFLLQIVCQRFVDGGWAVDIVKNGEPIQQDIRITDPLTSDQKETCRWYLQQYVRLSPFSVNRAEEAKAILDQYPHQLLDQLPLRRALLPQLEQGAYSLDPVTLLVDVFELPKSVESESDDSVHQLFWETLEYPELWSHPNWKVIVRRSLIYQRTNLPPQVHKVDYWANADGSKSLNVLLVVARDLTNDPSVYEDVSPSIATNTLLKIRHELNQHPSGNKLNVEIVRPGTFAAFKEHLRHSEKTRGPGYFHLVHFDTHGTVALKKGRAAKYGLLHFSQAECDKTDPRPGAQIAKVLKQHQIPYAVLNSCESASATAGDNANVAKLFLKAGLRGVIGMSFKIASSSVTIFLERFYNDLLRGGKSFAASAAAGREALRLNPMRPARYGLDRRLSDSFVAVTYEEGNNSSSFSDNLGGSFVHHWTLGSKTLDEGSDFAICQEASHLNTTSDEQELIGRDFEILRLEKVLMRTHVLFMSGALGVGKTALLKHAASVWKWTQLVQVIVHIELEKYFDRSGEKLLEDILRQILVQLNDAKSQMLLWTMSANPNSVASYDSLLLVDILKNLLSLVNAVIIMEYHEPSHLQLFIERNGAATTKAVTVLDTVQILFSLAHSPKPKTDTHLYFILTQRRRSLRGMEEVLGCQLAPYRLNLEGLRLSDAIELSKKVLNNAGEPVKDWVSEDVDCLEIVIHLLQGIPSALILILPLQRSRGIPWRRFHRELEKGLFASVSDLKSYGLGDCSMVHELESMYLPNKYELLVLLISLFWHKAPPMDEYVYLCLGINDEHIVDDVLGASGQGINDWYQVFKHFVHDRGYIHHCDGYILEVHPLFSIVGRAFLFDKWVTLANRVPLKTMLCATLQLCCFSPRGQNPSLELEPWNYLTALGFCTGEIPVERWPLKLLFPPEDWWKSSYPSSLKAYLRERGSELLRALSFKIPLLDQKGHHLVLYSCMNLLLCHSDKLPSKSTMERILQLSRRGQELMTTLSPSEDTDIVNLSRALLLSATMASSHYLGDYQQAHKAWKQMKLLDEEMHLAELTQNGHETSNNSQSFGSKPWLETQKELVSGVIQTLKDDMEKWENGTLLASEVKEQQTLVQESLQIFLDTEPRFPPAINSRDDVVQFILSGPSSVPREPSSEPSPHKLSDLESSYDAGDWLDTCERHISMAVESLSKDQFVDVGSHLECVYTLAKLNSASEAFITDVQACQNRMFMTHLAYLCHVTLFPARYVHRGIEYGFARRMNHTLHQRFAKESIWGSQALIWPSKDEKLSLFQDCKWWQWWQWFQESQGQDKTWVTHVRANLGLYLKQAEFMCLIFSLVCYNRFDNALIVLNELEALCNKSVFVHFPVQLSPLQCMRSCFELAFEHSSIGEKLDTWQLDSAEAQSYQALVTELLELRPSFCTWFPDSVAQAWKYATEKLKLYSYQVSMREATQAHDPTDLKATYQQLVSLIEGGCFSLLDESDLLTVRVLGLRYNLDRARDSRQWQEAISLCDEYLAISQNAAQDLPRSQDSWVIAKQECEWNMISDSLDEAEQNLDFEKCIQLLRKKYDIACRQRQTPGMSKTVIFLFGPRLYSFQMQLYQDQCLDCLAWLRNPQQPSQQNTHELLKQALWVCRHKHMKSLVLAKRYKTLPRKVRKGQRKVFGVGRIRQKAPYLRNPFQRHRTWRSRFQYRLMNKCEYGHNRDQFRRPFGCRCHCRGGYCFAD
ncbi:uncharacterized protein FTJAE_3612 [Fusarium tjaetaba]|uniref:CHAT domain-containing protein n=1 Tax=Fusarium tjaetaba TaxID=1567544 RepID=A0A8H5W1S4_9HYPO|nr:uncharacterized protein FTJAE_3612 [Fusarium tjaetaba]KAF5642455.1 hypothetical protein FTJAE_3612 [Fusarium tjaetaba]